MLKNFANIPVELPKHKILKRMGYNRHLTGISPEQSEKITYYIDECYKICEPAGRYSSIPITDNTGNTVTLETEQKIESASVAKLLRNSQECILLGAKVNPLILQEIDRFVAEKNGVAALIFDAVASEVVDETLTWMIRRLAMDMSRFGLKPTSMRYSAGYGDFPLENQVIFYNALKLEELGVTLSQNYIFSPEKTVTALCGLE